MDDLTVQSGQTKKKFGVGSIRKLGKFLGLGGRTSKSETKSQVDDYEEFDQINPPSNGIESIMALSPQQRTLAVMSIIGKETERSSTLSPTPNVSGGFKPKMIPPPQPRAPGKDPQTFRESEVVQDISIEVTRPVPPVHVPSQRVEDIIRQKLPLHRRNSKLMTSASTEERSETKEPELINNSEQVVHFPSNLK